MRRTLTQPRPERPYWGSRLLIWSAILLILLSGYALYYQVDTSRVWLDAIIRSNRIMGSSALQQLAVMFQSTPSLRLLLSQMLFLVAMMLFGILIIRLRKSLRACAVMLPVAGLCFWGGSALGLYSLGGIIWQKLISGLPLLLTAVGCLIQLAHGWRLAHPRRERPAIQHRRTRVSPPPIKRSPSRTPDRQYYDAPGATRMIPDDTQPAAPKRPVPKLRLPQRKEQPVPPRSASHIGETPLNSAQQPRYQWKTVKQSERKDVIGQ